MDIYNNFIDGAWIPARSRGTFENRNPANRDDVIGLFQDSSRDDVEAAVHAAERDDSPEERRRRVERVRQFSWERRIEELEAAIEEVARA